MAKEIIVTDTIIENRIFELRGEKIMLDRDLANLYEVETRRLNEQVKRNQERFPKNFMFRLTEDEVDLMVSQNAIPSKQVLGGSMPNAFTEHGVLMLANVIKSGKAIETSLRVIEIFVKLRKLVLENQEILKRLEQLDKRLLNIGHDVKMHDDEIASIFELVHGLIDVKNKPQTRNPIGFKTKNNK